MRLGHKLLLRERGFESPESIAFVRYATLINEAREKLKRRREEV